MSELSNDELDTFCEAYIECALWSSTDDSGNPLDKNYGIADLAPVTLDLMRVDCRLFAEQCYDMIADDLERAGHDFWLTRCGHGCGFWDGDWPENVEDILTQAAKAFGECNLYVGDDGQIHIM